MHTVLPPPSFLFPPPSAHRITSCTRAALHDPFCWVTLRLPLLVFVSCYPFIALHNVDTFLFFFSFLPECFCLVQNNDCARRNDASTCMAAPMTGLTDQPNWILSVWSPSICGSTSVLHFWHSLLFPSCIFWNVSHTKNFFFKCYFFTLTISSNDVPEILNQTAVLHNLPVKTLFVDAFTSNIVTFYYFSSLYSFSTLCGESKMGVL